MPSSEPKGKPAAPDGEDLYYCDNCDSLWREGQTEQLHDAWERIDDGSPMSSKECPDCGAMVFPAEGPPEDIDVELGPVQMETFKKHQFHDLTFVLAKGKPARIACKDCGNKIKRVVTEDEISKPEEEEEEEVA